MNDYHNTQVVTVELNMKKQLSAVKTIIGSSMILLTIFFANNSENNYYSKRTSIVAYIIL